MEKQFVLIGLLSVIGAVTIIVARVIGPRIVSWMQPGFNKATSKLDDMIVGPLGQWEATVQKIVETDTGQLKQRVAEIFSRFAKPALPGSLGFPASLPPSAKSFFESYSELSFDGCTQVLDSRLLRTVSDATRDYLVIGRSEDDDHFYAIDLRDKNSVVLLEMRPDGRVFSVEEDAPSFEHFVVLQHELYRRSD